MWKLTSGLLLAILTFIFGWVLSMGFIFSTLSPEEQDKVEKQIEKTLANTVRKIRL